MVSTAPMDLVQAAKAGETWAFEILLQPVVDPAYRLAWGMLRDRAAAEDAVQEASLLAWKNLAGLRRDEGMRAWFLAIVANQCRRARRQRWWSVLKFADLGAGDRAPAGEAEPATDLRRAIRRLDHRKRLVVVLHYYLDLPFDEIAFIVGSSEAAAKATLYRAIRELKPALEAKEN